MASTPTVETVKALISTMSREKERLEKEIILKNDDIEIEIRRKEAAEAEVAAMTRRIRLLEEDLEQSGGRLTDTSAKLDDASKAAEESESARWRLSNQQGVDELKITELERTIATATLATQESEWKYEETLKRITAAQQALATTQSRAGDLEQRVQDLEERLRAVAAEMKAKEVAREKNAKLEEVFSKRLEILRDQLKEAESRADAAEAAIRRYDLEIQRANETLHSESKTFTLLRKEMDSALDDYAI